MKFPQKVKQVFVQTAISLPGVFPPQTNLYEGLIPGIQMELHEFGLLITIVKDGVTHMAVSPSTNIKLAVLPSMKAELNESSSKTKSK